MTKHQTLNTVHADSQMHYLQQHVELQDVKKLLVISMLDEHSESEFKKVQELADTLPIREFYTLTEANPLNREVMIKIDEAQTLLETMKDNERVEFVVILIKYLISCNINQEQRDLFIFDLCSDENIWE